MQFVSSLVERPVVGVAFVLAVTIFVGNLLSLGYWARAEAAARDGSAVWTFVYFLSGFGLVYYVWVRHVRGDWSSRTEPADRRERLVTTYSLALVLAFVVGALVAPPDPVTQVRSRRCSPVRSSSRTCSSPAGRTAVPGRRRPAPGFRRSVPASVPSIGERHRFGHPR